MLRLSPKSCISQGFQGHMVADSISKTKCLPTLLISSTNPTLLVPNSTRQLAPCWTNSNNKDFRDIYENVTYQAIPHSNVTLLILSKRGNVFILFGRFTHMGQGPVHLV